MELKNKLVVSTVSTPFIFYTTVPNITPAAAEALQKACGAFHANESAAQTEGYFAEALNADPESAHLMSNLGSWQCAAGKAQEGVELLRRATEQATTCAGAWYNLGTLLLGHQMFGQARHYLAKAAELDDTSTAIHNNLGVALVHVQAYDDAIEEFKKALKCAAHHQGKFDPAHHNLGMIDYEKGAYAGAREHFVQAISANPHAALSYNALGCVHALEGNLHEAIQDFKRALAYNEQFTAPYHNTGVLVHHSNLLPEAEA